MKTQSEMDEENLSLLQTVTMSDRDRAFVVKLMTFKDMQIQALESVIARASYTVENEIELLKLEK